MENWKWIPGYEGRYKVSDLGNVKSYQRTPEGRPLKPGTMNKFGHRSVALGRRNSICVHTLVLLAFVGPRPAKADCCHVNGVGGDNRLENLKYGSRSENNRDMTRQGKNFLTIEQVKFIRDARQPGRNGDLVHRLAAKFSVKPRLIYAVWNRQFYNHG